MNKPNVELSEYNKEWAAKFEYEKNQIKNVVGTAISAVEHIGSTSIKGLTAKPIIDIMAGIDDLNRTEILIEPLSKIDFEYVPKPELTDRRFFRKGLWGKGTCHLHICEFQGKEWYEKLLFRDYLRNHPQAAKEYAQLKSELAVKFKFDRPAYTERKEPFIRKIIEEAKVEIS
ncbi:GrpB family protein [Lysinibacillus sphaericus]